MRGPDGARDTLALFIGDAMDAKVDALREAYGFDDGELPVPDTITSGEKPDNKLNAFGNTWVEVICARLSSSRVIDMTPFGPEYAITYAIRTYVWALGANWPDSIDRRDRVTGALRALLWEFPTLTLAGGDTGSRVEKAGWIEEYGVPARTANSSGRAWAAGVLSFDMIVEESSEPGALIKPIGTVERRFVQTETVGPYEPFPDDGPTTSEPLVQSQLITTGG